MEHWWGDGSHNPITFQLSLQQNTYKIDKAHSVQLSTTFIFDSLGRYFTHVYLYIDNAPDRWLLITMLVPNIRARVVNLGFAP